MEMSLLKQNCLIPLQTTAAVKINIHGIPFIKTEKFFHPSVNHFSYQLVHLKSMHILRAISSNFIFTIRPSTATPLFQAGKNQTAHLPYYLALLHQSSCILKYNPLDRIIIVRIYQQSGQWDS